jgi:aspartate/methionine/tyrosine aminotransferase
MVEWIHMAIMTGGILLQLPPFQLERWFAQFEFTVRLNLAASCAAPTSTAELLALAGESDRQEYPRLNLDYIENPGGERLRTAIAGWYTNLGADNIQVTTGASEAVFIIMNLLLAPGDRIVVQDPCYQSLSGVAEALGIGVVRWPLGAANGFHPGLDELESLITPGVRMVVVNHPHNPTGVMLTRNEQRRLADLTERHGIWLFSDEVYRGTVYRREDELPAAADLSAMAISVGDMTKPFGLGGIRIGWVACQNRGLLGRVSAFRDYTTMCSAAPSEFLAALAMEHREELLDRKTALARINLVRLAEFIDGYPGVLSWSPPAAGFTGFVRFDLPMSSEEFCRGLVERESALLLPGSVFGVKNHFRIGFGRDEQGFRAGLQAIGRYLDYLTKLSP